MYGEALGWLRLTVEQLASTPTGDCVPHPFEGGKDGYGSVYLDKRRMGMHRAALILAGGTPAGRGGHTRHLCGNPRCVNPQHIVAGTAKENTDDRERHGRTAYGPKIPQFHLTDEVVREIRSSRETNKAIAKRLNVDPSTISKIRRGLRRQRVV